MSVLLVLKNAYFHHLAFPVPPHFRAEISHLLVKNPKPPKLLIFAKIQSPFPAQLTLPFKGLTCQEHTQELLLLVQ